MTPTQQLRGFVQKLSPENQKLLRALRRAMRARVPGANELVYDNYNFLVIAYCPTEKTTDSYCSLGANANGVTLFFGYNGARLDDPGGLLEGTGASNRFVRLDRADALARPEIEALLAQAIALSKPPAQKKGALVIRSISAKQRPRR